MNEKTIHLASALGYTAKDLLSTNDKVAHASAHRALGVFDQLVERISAELQNGTALPAVNGDHDAEQRALEAGFAAPSVTQDRINELLARITYRYEQPEGTTATFAHAFLDGEFYLATGFSACVSPENYNQAIGEKYAGRDALAKATAKLWELEGYALRQRLREPR